MWTHCRDGWGNVHWPDGGAYLDQPLRLIHAFQVIAREWPKWDDKSR